jgi:hypothetical protein
MPASERPLIYSRGFVRSWMIEPGRTGAYLALFSEVGIVLLVAILAGVGIGYWVDQRVGSVPIFALLGLLVGTGLGARAVYVLVIRFLASFDDK